MLRNYLFVAAVLAIGAGPFAASADAEERRASRRKHSEESGFRPDQPRSRKGFLSS